MDFSLEASGSMTSAADKIGCLSDVGEPFASDVGAPKCKSMELRYDSALRPGGAIDESELLNEAASEEGFIGINSVKAVGESCTEADAAELRRDGTLEEGLEEVGIVERSSAEFRYNDPTLEAGRDEDEEGT
mmetsp:Transcript_1908/g.3345  ORF Transcript_1908/g.3345 Transcript_1908/m.3345 type:complete len:132 (+) Transcript_1908:252-647(+)